MEKNKLSFDFDEDAESIPEKAPPRSVMIGMFSVASLWSLRTNPPALGIQSASMR